MHMFPALLPWVSAAFLVVFAAVAALDGVGLHLWKLRLFARPASYVEHLWHTAGAVLFVPTIALLFVHSRRELGGLSRFELSVHIVAVVSRTAAIPTLLAARPERAHA